MYFILTKKKKANCPHKNTVSQNLGPSFPSKKYVHSQHGDTMKLLNTFCKNIVVSMGLQPCTC